MLAAVVLSEKLKLNVTCFICDNIRASRCDTDNRGSVPTTIRFRQRNNLKVLRTVVFNTLQRNSRWQTVHHIKHYKEKVITMFYSVSAMEYSRRV